MQEEISLNIEAWGEVEVKIGLEAALVFPDVEKNLRKLLGIPTIKVAIGMEGQLIYIKVWLKLSPIFSQIGFEIELYTEIKAFSFSSYCLFKFELEMIVPKIKFTFEFKLFEFEFNEISLEVHSKKNYKYLK